MKFDETERNLVIGEYEKYSYLKSSNNSNRNRKFAVITFIWQDRFNKNALLR